MTGTIVLALGVILLVGVALVALGFALDDALARRRAREHAHHRTDRRHL
jgi:hypothetical protein